MSDDALKSLTDGITATISSEKSQKLFDTINNSGKNILDALISDHKWSDQVQTKQSLEFPILEPAPMDDDVRAAINMLNSIETTVKDLTSTYIDSMKENLTKSEEAYRLALKAQESNESMRKANESLRLWTIAMTIITGIALLVAIFK